MLTIKRSASLFDAVFDLDERGAAGHAHGVPTAFDQRSRPSPHQAGPFRPAAASEPWRIGASALTEPPLLELRGVTKRYGAMLANDDASLVVQRGRICALLGENGAGKSTLLKSIVGAVRADQGEMFWRGRKVPFGASPAAGLDAAMVFQHFSLFETLTVGENIALTVGLPTADIASRVATLCAAYGWDLAADTLVYALSYGERQQVEIIRCLIRDPALLIMDEPTSVLSPVGVERLFVTLRQLAAEGRSVLFTSHKLDEVTSLCHEATIMRRGRTVAAVDPSILSSRDLAEIMIGSALPTTMRAESKPAAAPALVIDDVSFTPDDPFGRSLEKISLAVHPGEVVGIVGVSGNGQKELVDLIVGEQMLPLALTDRIILDGSAIGTLGIAERRAGGIAFIPEERLGRASVADMSLAENALLTARQLGFVRRGLIDRAAARDFVTRSIDLYDIRCSGPDAKARSLSGGNLQKFIAAREIAIRPKLLIAMQPTWGLDVAASLALRQRLLDLRQEAVGILVVSDDLSELLDISDRIYVMNGGRLSGSLSAAATPLSEISALMTGAAHGPAAQPQHGASA